MRASCAILHGDGASDIKLRASIALLVACHRRDGAILAAYQELPRQRKINCLDMMTEDLDTFINGWFDKGPAQSHYAAMMRSVLWGMCQYVAEANLSLDMSGADLGGIYHLMIGGPRSFEA
jgi:hypothetical protein